jgi:hypothetical protein
VLLEYIMTGNLCACRVCIVDSHRDCTQASDCDMALIHDNDLICMQDGVCNALLGAMTRLEW